MNLSTFFEQFPDEASCIEAFKSKKLQIGILCKKCQHTEHYFRKGDLKFERFAARCKKCKSRQSLRSGTVMEHSNLPFRYWMLCMELMTVSKKGFSALEMQRLIGHKRYEPIWYMMHKIRRIMGKRDNTYELSGSLEIDEGFFERVDNKELKDEKEGETGKNLQKINEKRK